MKKEERLWWAIRHPEEKVYDERVERLEGRGYAWAYWIFTSLLFFVHIFLSKWMARWGLVTAESISRFFLIAFVTIFFFVENGRFLYDCFHGLQQYHRDMGLVPLSTKSGMYSYLLNGFWSFFFPRMALLALFGSGDGKGNGIGWLISILCLFIYWGLCHLAYWHYARSQQDEEEERIKKRGRWVKILCIVTVSTIYLGCFVLSMWGTLKEKYGEVQLARVSKTEWEYLEEIEKGVERFWGLDGREVEYSYQLEDGNEIRGISKEELELPLPKVGYAASVTKEQTDRETLYTVRYTKDYRGIRDRLRIKDENKLIRTVTEAKEQYTLNEFGILTAYTYEERGTLVTSVTYEGDGKFGGSIEPRKEKEEYLLTAGITLLKVLTK